MTFRLWLTFSVSHRYYDFVTMVLHFHFNHFLITSQLIVTRDIICNSCDVFNKQLLPYKQCSLLFCCKLLHAATAAIVTPEWKSGDVGSVSSRPIFTSFQGSCQALPGPQRWQRAPQKGTSWCQTNANLSGPLKGVWKQVAERSFKKLTLRDWSKLVHAIEAG